MFIKIAIGFFFDRATFSIDGVNSKYDAPSPTRETAYKGVREYASLPVRNPKTIANKIIKSKETIARLSGKYYADIDVSEQMKSDMKLIIEMLDAIGYDGKIN